MNHIRLDLAYDGRQYFGFQSQAHGNTVQDILEKALEQVLQRPLRLTSASRTDTGVSAEHQVVTFRWEESPLDLALLESRLRSLLPSEIRVKSAQIAHQSFHPAYSALGKIYRYRIWKGECLNPFAWPYVWEQRRIHDATQLAKSLSSFVGTHDFKAFANLGSMERNTIRRIFDIKIEEQGGLINIWVSGGGFLTQMIRIMIGSALDESLGRLQRPITSLLQEPERSLAGRTAPSSPLSLIKILYDKIPDLNEFVNDYNARSAISLPERR
ncbi:MAG: tRNA pseudouridine(38-40) synthase TruA [Pseudomonadota bacterium]